ncbi:MAG: BlaI/MecI/CopY family transcriptional regulator [Planctomycetaceae bacterium]
MARRLTGRPTDQELEILKVLWDRGPSTVREVWQTIRKSRDIGSTSVLKIMQIMRTKGLVVCDSKQRPQVYRPRQSQQVTLKRLAGDLLNRVFGGSAKLLLLHALESQRAPAQEVCEIRRLLDEIEGKT